MTTTTLYLTAEEKNVFEKLSDSLKEGWTVNEETGTAYETDEDLEIRYRLARFNSYPQLQEMIEKVRNGAATSEQSLENIPKELLPTLYFTMGAKGIAAAISALLTQIQDDEGVKALAVWSMLRHDLLEANASTPSA